MKNIISKYVKLLLALTMFVPLTGCTKKETTKLYNQKFSGPFDTMTQLIAYTETSEEFDEYFLDLKTEMTRLHQLYDRYNNYEGINNIKTINDNAGIAPVKVDDEVFSLIEMSINGNKDISSNVNIAFGSVLMVWHNYRDSAEFNGGIGDIPSMAELTSANQHTDISKVILDKNNKTVYLAEKGMSLDVGAVAKGYAVELCKQKLIAMGAASFIISGGGNVTTHGKRLVEKEVDTLSACATSFCVGVESPGDGAYADFASTDVMVTADNVSIVTSGDYQRYYMDNDGNRYHHLIDPDTLMPGTHFRAVTVFIEDSGLADFLSTALFLTSYEEGIEYVENYDGLEAIWLMNDGTIKISSGFVEGENISVAKH